VRGAICGEGANSEGGVRVRDVGRGNRLMGVGGVGGEVEVRVIVFVIVSQKRVWVVEGARVFAQ